jgi:hypothetical protein
VNRYLPQIVCILSLLLGLSVGWYFGYTRPSVENQRKLVKEYETIKDAFQLTDKQMGTWGGRLPEFFGAVERQDEIAASMGLAALEKLEHEDVERAKSVLQKTISMYYRSHQSDGNTNVLRRITTFAGTNAALSNAIYGRLE